MNQLIKVIGIVVLMINVNTANAGIINFINLTEAADGYGEGAWSSLHLASGGAYLAITGHSSDDDDTKQYAYLDWGNAGVGSCKDALNPSAANLIHSGSGANNCAPSSDDNVTKKEFLRFIFDRDVVITNIWFNNNHDGGFGPGDNVKIDGNVYKLATGYAGDANGLGSFAASAGYEFDVSYLNEEFYISAIEFSAVPEPGALLLLCIGMLAVFTARKTLINNK